MDHKLIEFFLDLMREKLTGTISPEDELLLKEIISAYPDAATDYAEQFDMHHSPAFRAYVTGKVKRQATPKVATAVKDAKHLHKFEIMKAAAVLLLIISGILCFYYSSPTFSGKNAMLAFSLGNRQDTVVRTLVVLRGKEDSVHLSDGSTVHINAASRLQVQFSKDKRKVDFRGEAYFKVAPGRKPFIVTTPYATIEVLGTEFNVNTYDSGVTRISLVKGKIRVRAMGKDTLLYAGEELIYTHGITFERRPCKCNITLAWQRGECHFVNENLKSIAPRLERLFDTCVVVDDERLLDKTYTGMIDKSIGLMANINNIPTPTKFDCHFSGDTLHITSK